MTREERAIQRRMTPEEKAEMRRAEKEVRVEVLSWKLAVSAEINALKTEEERLAYFKKIADECRARGLNVVSRRSSL
jgi:hypothetical protein